MSQMFAKPNSEIKPDSTAPNVDTPTSVTDIKSLDDFRAKIIRGDKSIAICEFTATWSTSCNAILPIFEKLANLYPHAHYYKVETDKQEAISKYVGINKTPTFIAYKNNKRFKDIVSADPAALMSFIKSVADK